MGYERELAEAIAAVKDAGRILRDEFHRPGGPRGAGAHCPADEEAEAVVRARLGAAFPEYGLVGEELRNQDRDATDRDRHVWLVDPNDGTSSFRKGWRGNAVSVGLIRAGRPVAGVVFAPCYPNDDGDLIAWAEGSPLTRQGVQVEAPGLPDRLADDHTVLVSYAADTRTEENGELCAPARFLAMPSIAYRLALVAVGEGEAAVSLNGPVGWDYAGGHALLAAVGGALLDSNGTAVRYGVDGASDCRGRCFGGHEAVAEELAGRDWDMIHGSPRSGSHGVGLASPVAGETIADARLLSRAQGVVLGQLAGDSLGSLVEFAHPQTIAARHPKGVRQLVDGGTWDTLAGQPTDDSELALALARTLVRCERFDDDAVASAYGRWLASGPFDVGSTTRRAFSAARKAAERAAEAARAAANLDSQANGSLMRISPLAVFGWQAPETELAGWARADAALSHPHPACGDAAATFCVAIRRALTTSDTGPAVYEYTLGWAARSGIREEVLGWLRDAGSRPPEDFLHQQGWVRVAFQNAFYQLAHAASLEQGVIDTVAQGGDTDTNGAIAGALLGSVSGYQGIPRQWRNRVLTCRPLAGFRHTHQPRSREYWPVDALVLAERLLLGCRGR